MSVNETDFVQLIDSTQIDALLTSMVKLTPQALFVIDAEGNLVASAQSIEIPENILHDLPRLINPNGTPFLAGSHVSETHTDVVIEDNTVGYIIALSAPSNAQNTTAAVNLVKNILTEQIYKEFELNRMTEELLNKYEEINLLYELSQDLGVVFDVETICHIALERALEIVKAEKAFIALMDDHGEFLTVVAAQNIQGFEGWQIPVGQGVSGYVAQAGKHIILRSQDTLPEDTNKHRVGFKSILAVPLVLPAADLALGEDKVLGVMTLTGKPLGQVFTAGEAQLATTIMTQVTVAIYNSRLVQSLQNTERVQQQMEIASRIQQSLLPKNPPKLPGIAVAGECLPTTKVGGDYYDYLVDESNRLTLLIADASGHSLGSALMITMARSILRHEISRGRPLDRILVNINRAMLEDLSKAEMFISLFCARYDPDKQTLSFVNAGHNPPLLQRAADQKSERLDDDTGIILGIADDVAYREQAIALNPGDVLLLYTDGVIEARNPSGEQFGETRLQKILAENHTLPVQKLCAQIYQTIRQHIKDAEQHDDITLLILKINQEET